MSEALFLPRRLAIRLMAEAQRAAGGAVQGLIGARAEQPASVLPSGAGEALEQRGETLWASYRTHASGEPALHPEELQGLGPSSRHLGVSVDLKGVLQVRLWERDGRDWRERPLVIGD